MVSADISPDWIMQLNEMFPEQLRFLRAASINYSPQPIRAKDKDGVREIEEFPVVSLCGQFSGMRQSGVTAQPLDHLSGFHVPYMLPQLCYAGLAHMAIDGRIRGAQAMSLDYIRSKQKEFLVAQNDSRFFHDHVPLADDTIIYGTVHLLNDLRLKPELPGCPAKVYYMLGSSPNATAVSGRGAFFLNLGQLVQTAMK